MKKILIIHLILIINYSYGQIGFEENTVDEGSVNIDRPLKIFSNDIDNDGDIDIVCTSDNNEKIVWYENLDGNGNYSSQRTIYTFPSETEASSLFIIDIDNDGDTDIITSTIGHISQSGDGAIYWFEYLEDVDEFSAPIVIDDNVDGSFRSIISIDINNDNDNDVIITKGQSIVWYENLDGNGNFGSQQVIDNSNDIYNILAADDIDGDNDNDIIAMKREFSDTDRVYSIIWFENTNGLGNFNSNYIITQSSSFFRGTLSDLDNDGDIDFLFSNNNTNVYPFSSVEGWSENIDGQGNFSSQQIISTSGIGGCYSLSTADLDGDNDLDIIVEYGDGEGDVEGEIVWYENINGMENLGTKQIITSLNYNWTNKILANDINGDGKMDLLYANHDDDRITWYKNLGITKNEINGSIKFDENNDGCNSSNLTAANILVSTTNGSESLSTFTSENGYYQLFTETGDFTTSAINSQYYTANPNSYSNNFQTIGNIFNANFCLNPLFINNLNISIIPKTLARPGFSSNYRLIYKNIGATQTNGNIIFEFNQTKLSFLSASENISSQTSNSLAFDYVNLAPFETRTIDLEFNVLTPPTVNINDELVFTATIDPIVDDEFVDDNVYSLNQTVIGSYDPNDIICLEGNQILIEDIDEYLHYVIRFQNTGTAHAVKVVVENLLDEKLDWTTLQLESISHNNRVEIKNGNEISFIFDAIYLPDSTTDEPNSHGFIAYKIKPKTDIALDDVILNKADIFFDYNSPIETNTASTTIVNVLAVNENTLLDFSVYPTPTENILKIKSKTEISKIEIYNKLGQLILKNETKNNIDISNLTNGLYFVKAEDINGNFGVKKIMKK